MPRFIFLFITLETLELAKLYSWYLLLFFAWKLFPPSALSAQQWTFFKCFRRKNLNFHNVLHGELAILPILHEVPEVVFLTLPLIAFLLSPSAPSQAPSVLSLISLALLPIFISKIGFIVTSVSSCFFLFPFLVVVGLRVVSPELAILWPSPRANRTGSKLIKDSPHPYLAPLGGSVSKG